MIISDWLQHVTDLVLAAGCLYVLLTNIKYSGSGLACCVWSTLTASQLGQVWVHYTTLHSSLVDDILF